MRLAAKNQGSEDKALQQAPLSGVGGIKLISVPQRLDGERVVRSYAYSVRICYGNDSNLDEISETYDIRLRKPIEPKEGQSPTDALLDLLSERGVLSAIRRTSSSPALKKRKDPEARTSQALSDKVKVAERLRREAVEGDPMGGSPGCEVSQKDGQNAKG